MIDQTNSSKTHKQQNPDDLKKKIEINQIFSLEVDREDKNLLKSHKFIVY